MSEPFLAEVRIFGFTFAPRGWALCDGQILPINQNQSLYSLLGTSYGGDGRTSFALPDLRGRAPVHAGGAPGGKGGAETVTLTANEMPSHSHQFNGASEPGNTNLVTGNVLASVTSALYGAASSPTALSSGAISDAGGGQAHNNMQPYTTLSFCIALQGLFPSRN